MIHTDSATYLGSAEIVRAQLNRQVSKFLRSGGKVTKIKFGVSGIKSAAQGSEMSRNIMVGSQKSLER